DLEYAITDRAVQTYTPGTPLYLYIIDHGYSDDGIHGPYFLISPNEVLYADELNTMLNTYETATGGQVIVINESCYSGAFMSRLKKPGRIVITSASDHIVNYDNYGSDSFTHHFLRYLFENNTLHQAFSKSVRRLQESNLTFYQTPQLDDNGDGKYDDSDGLLTASLRLGGDFALGAPWPEILSLEKGELSGTSVSFTLSTNARMKRVWATIQPPGYIPEINGNYQNIELEFFNLSDNDEDLTYTGTYEKFTEKGQYILTFYAKDQFGNIAQSAPVRIDVNVSPGDVNGDGDVTLADAVLSLKICAGEDMTGQNISRAADMNQDNRIGTEEAVSVLRKTAGL
ncbi:MAG: C13 family peptidase, partial [Desulfobacterales bacterium]